LEQRWEPESNVLWDWTNLANHLWLPYGSRVWLPMSLTIRAGGLADSARQRRLGAGKAALDLLALSRVGVSVSNEVIPGARVTVGGKPMEGLIAGNIARIAERGLLVGGITVRSRVTAGSLPEVHACWECLGVPYRLLPLFRNAVHGSRPIRRVRL
jgi:hypothetical protein